MTTENQPFEDVFPIEHGEKAFNTWDHRCIRDFCVSSRWYSNILRVSFIHDHTCMCSIDELGRICGGT